MEAVEAEDAGFDCRVGASNWMKGWSFKKMDWCCKQQKVGCRKFHCSGAATCLSGMVAQCVTLSFSCHTFHPDLFQLPKEHTWEANKREWCPDSSLDYAFCWHNF